MDDSRGETDPSRTRRVELRVSHINAPTDPSLTQTIARGFDLVEVAPAYDTNGRSLCTSFSAVTERSCLAAEITSVAAADLIHEFLSMLLHESPKPLSGDRSAKDEL